MLRNEFVLIGVYILTCCIFPHGGYFFLLRRILFEGVSTKINLHA